MIEIHQQKKSVEMLFPLLTAIESTAKCLIYRRRPFFGLLEWWWPAETLLGLDVAYGTGTKRLPTPDIQRYISFGIIVYWSLFN